MNYEAISFKECGMVIYWGQVPIGSQIGELRELLFQVVPVQTIVTSVRYRTIGSLLVIVLEMQEYKVQRYCGWALTDLQARVYEADQGSQTLWDH